VRRAEALIEQRYNNPRLRQKSVAKVLGLSASSLSAAFRAEGMTFSQCVRRIRLDKAVSLLATHDGRIKDVWTRIGYNHPSNFNHDFKHRFGMTPRAYRARLLNHQPFEEHLILPTSIATHCLNAVSGISQTVLLIDEHKGIRDTLSWCLRMKGHVVFSASSATEGLVKAARLSPNVIVLEQRLRAKTGLECLKELRTNSSLKVLLTADWNTNEDAKEIRDAGAIVAWKPIGVRGLCNLIASATSADRRS
jgi:AraC-like DNA-binding protein/CheY-like chemotaxis protein